MDDYWFAKADGLLWRAISQLVPLGTGNEMELVTDNTLRFTCCSELLYVFKENH